MLILLSPAKIQNFKQQQITEKFSYPEFINEAGKLVDLIRKLSPYELSKLLDINSNLTQLNFDRFFNWHLPFNPENAKQAVLVFDGEVYRGLDAKSFSSDDFEYAQNHLRLLSGLYGVLRPLDLIQPYRLEVSSKLINPQGNNLYDFWQKKITKSIVSALLDSVKPAIILNLASSEYFKSLNLKNKKVRVIDVEFYEYKHDNFKQIVIYTKKARGLLARFVIENRIEDEENLKGFNSAGYWYSPQMSTDNKLVFIR